MPNAPSDLPRSDRASDVPPRGRSVAAAPARPLRWVLVGGVLLLVTVVAFASAKSYRDLAIARDRARDLATAIERAEWRIRELSHELERLQDDPQLLERIAREELGLVAPGEVIVVLPED